MNPETNSISSRQTKICQNCKQQFTIEPDDFRFYEKIKVPPPTFCPECRLTRRLLWRNEYKFYKRKCNAPKHAEDIISTFSADKPFPIYDAHYWWSDAWDAINYAQDYDFSKPFFEQLYELNLKVPKPSLTGDYATMIRSDYSNWAGHLKNCYLITDADYVEDSAYGSGICRAKDCFDNDFLLDSELAYYNFDIEKCYRAFFCVGCKGSNDIYFSKNCIGCQNCFGCSNLRNKSHYIFNEPCSKEEYAKKIAEFDLGSWKSIAELKAKAHEFWMTFPQKYIRGFYNTGNVTGDYIYHSKNTQFGFLVTDIEDSKFIALTHAKPTRDCYDYTDWGEVAERVYEGMSVGLGAYNIKFSDMIFRETRDVEYSYFCMTCSNIFGCVGLRNKQFCILNKQYSENEYEEILPKIIAHMNEMPYVDKKGRVYKYGEFFPPKLSVFIYNETVAQEYFPVTKEKALEEGYGWKDPEPRNYQITIPNSQIPDHIKDAPDSITKEVIECAHQGKCTDDCTTAFRFIPDELRFYHKTGVPLPRLCPICRHYERIKERNPMKLWRRKCMCEGTQSAKISSTVLDSSPSKDKSQIVYTNTNEHFHGQNHCPNEFETSYAPNRPEIVYCEQCYQTEVV